MSFQKIQHHPLFVKLDIPANDNQVPSILKERYERTLKSYQKSYCMYYVDSQTGYKQDSYEQMSQYYISISKPECIRYDLISLQRVILPANSPLPMYENDKNELDSHDPSNIHGRKDYRISINGLDALVPHIISEPERIEGINEYMGKVGIDKKSFGDILFRRLLSIFKLVDEYQRRNTDIEYDENVMLLIDKFVCRFSHLSNLKDTVKIYLSHLSPH